MKYRKSPALASFLIGLLLSSGVPAQDDARQRALDEALRQVRVWQVRVNDLTTEIVSESSTVSAAEQSMYLALLAKFWWKTDETAASVHLKKAGEKMLAGVVSDEKDGIQKNLKFAQKTLEIISGLDDKLTRDLIGRLEAAVEGRDGDRKKANPEMAELFVSVGRQVVDSDPKLALAAGIDSLIYGFGMYLPWLAAEINDKDPLLAEMLVKRALALAKGNLTGPSAMTVFNLNRQATDLKRERVFSIELQRAIVEVFADNLAAAAGVEAERPTRCGLAYYAPAFLPRVDEFFPGRSVTFRQNLAACASSADAGSRAKVETSSEEARSIDEVLKAAREAKDPELKIRFYRNALSQLQTEKRFEEMASVLDGLDGDDFRKAGPGGWNLWRIDAGHRSALAAFEADDLPAAYRHIDRTPKSLRPQVRKELLGEPEVLKNKEFVFENLDQMQRELGAIELPVEDAALMYLELAHLSITVRPTDSELMFRHAVKYINKADSENPEFLVDKDWAPMEEYVALKSELLEIDETSIISSLNKINSRRSRVRLKLGLLESALPRYKEATLKLEDLQKKRSVAKGQPV